MGWWLSCSPCGETTQDYHLTEMLKLHTWCSDCARMDGDRNIFSLRTLTKIMKYGWFFFSFPNDFVNLLRTERFQGSGSPRSSQIKWYLAHYTWYWSSDQHPHVRKAQLCLAQAPYLQLPPRAAQESAHLWGNLRPPYLDYSAFLRQEFLFHFES